MIAYKKLFYAFVFGLVSLNTACTPEPATVPTSPTATDCQVKTFKLSKLPNYVSTVVYDAQHRITKLTNISITNYIYNSNGVIIREIEADSTGRLQQRVEYTYNTAQKLIKLESFDSTSAVILKKTTEYDANMRVVRQNLLQNNAITNYSIKEYNNSTDLPYKMTDYLLINSVFTVQGYTLYTYDTNKNLLNATYYNANNIRQASDTYTYDNKKLGLMIDFAGIGKKSYHFVRVPHIGSNNILSVTKENFDNLGISTGSFTTSLTYNYNSDNFPISSSYTPTSGTISTVTADYHCH